MPRINLNEVEASDVTSTGVFTALPAGGYVCKIVDVEHVPEREYFWLVIDIAEGEHIGYYSDAWGVAHPTSHRVLVSYKESALGMLKGRLSMLTDCNPGFDAIAAFQGDNWEAFYNKKVGLVVGLEEYVSNTGDVRERLNWFNALWRTPEQIRTGKFKVPATKKLDTKPDKPDRPKSKTYDDPLPFE